MMVGAWRRTFINRKYRARVAIGASRSRRGVMVGSTAHVVDWDSVECAFPYDGVTRQTVISTDATLTRYTYAPGCVFPVHEHPDAQITVVHTGVIEFDVSGTRVVLRAGQVALIPGGVPHGARVTGDETVVTDNYFASATRAPLAVVRA
jgi:mannose-6-phosphate isomerase-like protein (cupin superfamily)